MKVGQGNRGSGEQQGRSRTTVLPPPNETGWIDGYDDAPDSDGDGGRHAEAGLAVLEDGYGVVLP
jgi:hypothetical protein